MPVPTTTSVDRPRSKGYGARINDLLLRLAVGPDDNIQLISTVDNEPLRLETGQNPEDFLPSTGKVYSLTDLTGGENLDFAHRGRSDNDAIRYWRANGLVPIYSEPGSLGGVRLARTLDRVYSFTGTNAHVWADPNATDAAYYSDGALLYRVAQLVTDTPARTSESWGGTQDILGIVSLGSVLYLAAGSDGIRQRTSGGSWSQLSAVDTSRVWTAKGRLFAAQGAVLAEVDTSTGTPTTVITGPTGTSFTSVVDAGPVILAASTTGAVYSMSITDAAALVVSSQTQMPGTEVPTFLGYNASQVLVGTAAPSPTGGTEGRVYRGEIGSSTDGYALSNLQLLRRWDDQGVADHTPRGVANTRDSMLFLAYEGGDSIVYRYWLATQGLVQELRVSGQGPGQAVTVVKDRAVAGVNGYGFCVESLSTFVSTGYVISPAVDFYTSADKVWTDITVYATINQGRLRVSWSSNLDAMHDPNDPSWQQLAAIEATGSTGQPISLSNAYSRWLILKLELDSVASDSTVSSVITAAAVRAQPQGKEIRARVPVNLSDTIERLGRLPLRVPGWGRKIGEQLFMMRGRAVTLELFRDQLVIQGTLERVQMPRQGVGKQGHPGERGYIEVLGRIVRFGDFSQQIVGPIPRGITLRGRRKRGA